MKNNLKEIQEFVRTKVIMAAHPECKTLEEALEIEAKKELLDESDGPYGYGQWITIREGIIYKSYADENDDFVENDWLMSVDDFFRKILTLARVLNALQKTEINSQSLALVNCWKKGYLGIGYNDKNHDLIEIGWLLLNEDGTDCAFEQQEEATQLAIAKLLNYVGGGSDE